MIEVSSVHKSYAQKAVLKHIDMKLEAGKAYAILGGNGAGKSTLIKSMMGLVAIDSGKITKQGYCTYLPEQPYLPLSMSAWQLVGHACRMQGQSQEHIKLLLNEVKLQKDAWHKKMLNYSKGMRQRTAIAYALAGKPDWIILDEPMSGLDAMGRSLMLELFQKRHQAGMGILMCSHMVTDIVKLCSEVFIIVRGEVKEAIKIQAPTMDEANKLEQRLRYWSGHEALD